MKYIPLTAVEEVVADTEDSNFPATNLNDGKAINFWKAQNSDTDGLLQASVNGTCTHLGVVNSDAFRATITNVAHLGDSEQTAISDDVRDYVVESSTSIIATGLYVTWADSDGGTIAKAAGLPEKMQYHTVGTDLKIYDITGATASLFRTVDLTGYTIQGVSKHGVEGIILIASTTAMIAYDAINDSATAYTTVSSPAIVSNDVNYVDITAQPGADTDATTGLLETTKLAGTAAGGTWVTGTTAVDVTGAIDIISCSLNSSAQTVFASTTKLYVFDDVTSDTLANADHIFDTAGSTSPHIDGTINEVEINEDYEIYVGTDEGKWDIEHDSSTPTDGGVRQATTSFNTGMMRGDVVVATLMDTATGDIAPAVGAIEDRSVKDNALDVSGGTVGREAAATGTDTVRYTEETTSAIITQPTHADLTMDAGLFHFVFWLDCRSTISIFELDPGVSVTNKVSGLYFNVEDDYGNSGEVIYADIDQDSSEMRQIIMCRNTGGVLEIYDNGVLAATDTGDNVDLDKATTLTLYPNLGMSHFRMFKGAITAGDAAAYYRDEAPMFRNGGRGSLQGASNNVVSVAINEQGGQDYAATADKTTCFYKGAVSRVIEVELEGTELITNGTFDTDLSGWVDGSTGTGSVVWNAGVVDVVRVDSGNQGRLIQSISTKIGSYYGLSSSFATGTLHRVFIGTTSGGTEIGSYTLDDIVFQATSTTTYITLNLSNTGTAGFDDISTLLVTSAIASNDHASISAIYGIYAIVTDEEAAIYDINSTVEIQSITSAISAKNTFFLPLPEKAEENDIISIYLDSRKDGEQLSAGLVFAGENIYSGQGPEHGLVKRRRELSPLHLLNNRRVYKPNDKGRLDVFDLMTIDDSEDAYLLMDVEKAIGTDSGLWSFGEDNRTDFYGHMMSETIQLSYDYQLKKTLTVTIIED